MPAPYPAEFRDGRRPSGPQAGGSTAQIAKDFGISEATLQQLAEEGRHRRRVRSGVTTTEAAELRELKKRNRLLEQENEILRRAAAYFAKELPPK